MIPSVDSYGVKQGWTWLRKDGPHLKAAGARRWLAFLLTFALLASGLSHFAVAGHDVSSQGHTHELVWLGDDAGNEPCCPEHRGQPHATNCSMAGVCFLCVPVNTSTPTPHSEAGTAHWTVETVHSGRIASVLFRPPRLS